MLELPSAKNGFHHEHACLLARTYRQFVGHDLMEDAAPSLPDFGDRLYHAPFFVASHGTQEDPIFNYGNQAALDLFEFDWDSFIELPSRKSAEPVNREERARLLEAVTRQNYIANYAGVRISSTGRRFHIPAATVWNVIDEAGQYRGQAATFSNWKHL